jgi:hypothetical protein
VIELRLSIALAIATLFGIGFISLAFGVVHLIERNPAWIIAMSVAAAFLWLGFIVLTNEQDKVCGYSRGRRDF